MRRSNKEKVGEFTDAALEKLTTFWKKTMEIQVHTRNQVIKHHKNKMFENMLLSSPKPNRTCI